MTFRAGELGEPMTWREAVVCDFIVAGMPRARIAEILGISNASIQKHGIRLLQKHGARNDADLVRIVMTGRLALKVMPRRAA